MRRWLLIAVFSLFGGGAFAQQPDAAALHDELRALRQRVLDAVNKGDIDSLVKELSPTIRFTSMNNELVSGLDQARDYEQRMFGGSNSLLQKMSLTADPDTLSMLYASNAIAIATGKSVASLTLRSGATLDVPLRWTATLDRGAGKWSIAALHFSADVFDNPVLAAATSLWKWASAAAAVVGLVVGFLLGRARRRSA